MRDSLLGKLVLVLSRATPEKLAAIYRFAESQVSSADRGGDGPSPAPRLSGTLPGHALLAPVPKSERSAYVFRWTGRDWEVVFGGGRAFHLPNVLGARYLDYLLHRPNEPISAFGLEVAVSPEKGEARARNSIQPGSDARALGEYREELRRMQAKRKELEAAGDMNGLDRLDSEVAALQTALASTDGAADTGQRAFDNVRKAVGTLRKHLRQAGPEERAFEEHLRRRLSLGHECLYCAPDGRVWA